MMVLMLVLVLAVGGCCVVALLVCGPVLPECAGVAGGAGVGVVVGGAGVGLRT